MKKRTENTDGHETSDKKKKKGKKEKTINIAAIAEKEDDLNLKNDII